MIRTYLHAFRFEQLSTLPVNVPTLPDLYIFSHILRNSLYDSNTTLPLTNDERGYDTVATSIDINNRTILVAVNIKERVDEVNSGTSNPKVVYGNEFGIKEEHVAIVSEMAQYFEEYGNFKVVIVTTEVRPTKPAENAAPHAEMQLLAYAKENGLHIDRMGISKAPCSCCKNELDRSRVEHEHSEEGNQRPKNWQNPKNIKTKTFKIINIENPHPKESAFKWKFRHNLPSTVKQAGYNAKRSVKLQMTMNCTVSTTGLLDMYDNYDRPSWAKYETNYCSSGEYQSDRTHRKGYYWKAGVLEASTGASIFSAKFNLLTVSANAERNIAGISAGINATIVSMQLDAGPLSVSYGIKASIGFSAGIDGIEAQFLGTGFSFGPEKLQLRTPFVDFKINPNAIFAALFIAIKEIPRDQIDPKYWDDFQFLVSTGDKFFSGQYRLNLGLINVEVGSNGLSVGVGLPELNVAKVTASSNGVRAQVGLGRMRVAELSVGRGRNGIGVETGVGPLSVGVGTGGISTEIDTDRCELM